MQKQLIRVFYPTDRARIALQESKDYESRSKVDSANARVTAHLGRCLADQALKQGNDPGEARRLRGEADFLTTLGPLCLWTCRSVRSRISKAAWSSILTKSTTRRSSRRLNSVDWKRAAAMKSAPVGSFITQWSRGLLLSEFVVADPTLTDANVFYELGIRHAAKPFTTVPILANVSTLSGYSIPLPAHRFLRGSNQSCV